LRKPSKEAGGNDMPIYFDTILIGFYSIWTFSPFMFSRETCVAVLILYMPVQNLRPFSGKKFRDLLHVFIPSSRKTYHDVLVF